MFKKLFLVITFLFALTLLVDSCATQKNHKRKCNGQKAIKTPMGNM